MHYLQLYCHTIVDFNFKMLIIEIVNVFFCFHKCLVLNPCSAIGGGDEETPCFQRSRALTHQISQTKTDGSFTREQACE